MLELSTAMARAERNGGSMAHSIILQIKLSVGDCDFEVKNAKPPFIFTVCVMGSSLALLGALQRTPGLHKTAGMERQIPISIQQRAPIYL